MNYLLQLGVAQSAIIALIFFSSVFWKKCIADYFVFQFKQSVSKGLKP